MIEPTLNSYDGLQPLQHDVQRHLGRCLLRLQQYERSLKTIVAHHRISGPIDSADAMISARKDATRTKTLGVLVGELIGSCVVSEDAAEPEPDAKAKDDAAWVDLRFQVHLPHSDYQRACDGLRELVRLRNDLVHHFIDQHDLWTIGGCREALDSLAAHYERIGVHCMRLREWAASLEQVRDATAEYMASDAFRDLIVDGIASDGRVHWPSAGIVATLHEAACELAIDGWTRLADAKHWIENRYPLQTPARYSCRRWNQVLHESRAFELCHRGEGNARDAWYRAHPST